MPEEEPKTTDFSAIEKDAIGEIANISMGAAATALSNLIGKRVQITTPELRITTKKQLQVEYPLPYVVVDVQYTEGFSGENLFIIKEEDAAIIVDLMMGGDGSNPPKELDELHLSAISEAMNQMMGAAATSMSTIFQRKVNISPPSLRLVNLAKEQLEAKIDAVQEQLIHVVFKITIEGLMDSEMMQLLPVNFAKNLTGSLLGSVEEEAAVVEPAIDNRVSMPLPPEKEITQREPDRSNHTVVQPVQFAPFAETSNVVEPGNLDLILDVNLDFTVELGKTKKTIREILDFGPGSIVELDKLAGEPVDILVNGMQIAKGEVVVIDENYGVRITEILSSSERFKNLQ